MTYTPFSPETYNLYSSVRTRNQDTTPRINILKKPRPPTFNPYIQQAQLVAIETLGTVQARVHRGLAMALDEVGGIGVVLFLYARVSWRNEWLPSGIFHSLILDAATIMPNFKCRVYV